LKIMLLYATMGRLRLFASERTVEAAEKVLSRIIETCGAERALITVATSGNLSRRAPRVRHDIIPQDRDARAVREQGPAHPLIHIKAWRFIS
jgi:hypothetical protein